MFRTERFVIHRPVSLESMFKKSCQSVSQLVRYEQNCTLVASHQAPSTSALESFCEFSFSKYLEYCLKELLSNFEGLSIFGGCL